MSIAGMGGVLVRRECRSRGYCRMAVGAAEAFASGQMRVKFNLLFCKPALHSLYEHLGWTKVSSPLWAEQVRGNVLLPIVAMVTCWGPEQWLRGEIHLGSRPW